MNIYKIPKLIFILGIIFFIAAVLIPHNSMEFLLGPGLRPMGLVSLFINPVLGILGSIISLINRQWKYLILNIILIFTFPIFMFVGYGLESLLYG